MFKSDVESKKYPSEEHDINISIEEYNAFAKSLKN